MYFYFERSFKFKQKQNWLKLIDKLIVTHSLYNYFANYGHVYFICNNLDRKDFVTKKSYSFLLRLFSLS